MTRLCIALATLLAVALVVLAIRPELDLAIANVFYAGHGRFVANTPLGVVARYALWYLPFATFAVLLVAGLARRLGLAVPWAPGGRAMLFLAVTFVFGPGAGVTEPVKRLVHRPRPTSVTEFDGTARFRRFDATDGVCPRSCSFPSAETAAETWMLAPASLAPPPWRPVALAGGVLLAVATGTLRLAFGGHFLSDVCGGALATILVILACRAMLGWAWRRQ